MVSLFAVSAAAGIEFASLPLLSPGRQDGWPRWGIARREKHVIAALRDDGPQGTELVPVR